MIGYGIWMKNTITFTLFTLCLLAGCHHEEPSVSDQDPLDGLYLSTSSQSQARAEAVLPAQGSEDVSHLLGTITIPNATARDEERDNYLPEEATDWIVDVQFPEGNEFEVKRLAQLFDKSFREEHGGLTLYGKDAKTGFWTYLISADGPTSVTGLKISWNYYSAWNDDAEVATAQKYQARLQAIESVLQADSIKAVVQPNRTTEDAAARTLFLSYLPEQVDRTVAFAVVAPEGKPFEGRKIWDVMLCLGLTWGDMDCFHWINPTGIGDDYYFSVETSTPPGYFLPEEIAMGRVHTQDLVFLFSLPRTAAPSVVAARMRKAVEYVQSRLGGKIVYMIDDEQYEFDSAIQEIGGIEAELTEHGFPPGSDAALRFF